MACPIDIPDLVMLHNKASEGLCSFTWFAVKNNACRWDRSEDLISMDPYWELSQRYVGYNLHARIMIFSLPNNDFIFRSTYRF